MCGPYGNYQNNLFILHIIHHVSCEGIQVPQVIVSWCNGQSVRSWVKGAQLLSLLDHRRQEREREREREGSDCVRCRRNHWQIWVTPSNLETVSCGDHGRRVLWLVPSEWGHAVHKGAVRKASVLECSTLHSKGTPKWVSQSNLVCYVKEPNVTSIMENIRKSLFRFPSIRGKSLWETHR